VKFVRIFQCPDFNVLKGEADLRAEPAATGALGFFHEPKSKSGLREAPKLKARPTCAPSPLQQEP
jgi:hypothetical protein